MTVGLPLPIEMAFLVLVLPLAFAYLFSVAGIVAMSARAALRDFASRLRLGHRNRPVPNR